MKKLVASLTIIITVILFACSKSMNSSTTNCSVAKSFASDVNPIIQSHCATNSRCHAAGSNNGPGPLTTYSQIYDTRAVVRAAVINRSTPENRGLTNAQSNNIVI